MFCNYLNGICTWKLNDVNTIPVQGTETLGCVRLSSCFINPSVPYVVRSTAVVSVTCRHSTYVACAMQLLAIISYSHPTLNYAWYFYYIWILWRSFVTHQAICSITIQTCFHLGEFIWTKYVRSIPCSVLNVDRMKSWLSSSRIWQVLLLDWNL
jgi:hypothetical protein